MIENRQTSLFSGIWREIRKKNHQKFAEKMQFSILLSEWCTPIADPTIEAVAKRALIADTKCYHYFEDPPALRARTLANLNRGAHPSTRSDEAAQASSLGTCFLRGYRRPRWHTEPSPRPRPGTTCFWLTARGFSSVFWGWKG